MATIGSPGSTSTKDLMAKTHQLPISVMIQERKSRWVGHASHRSDNSMVIGQTTSFCYEDSWTCAACCAALWHWEKHEQTYLGLNCQWRQVNFVVDIYIYFFS